MDDGFPQYPPRKPAPVVEHTTADTSHPPFSDGKICLGRIGEIDLSAFINDVYEMSQPQGMGFLHFRPDPLTHEELQEIISSSTDTRGMVRLDYVKGRSCKMTIWLHEEHFYIRNTWYDHSPEQLHDLLTKHKITTHSLMRLRSYTL